MKSFVFAAAISGAIAAYAPPTYGTDSPVAASSYPGSAIVGPTDAPTYGSKTVTEVLTSFTTFCTEATSLTYGGQTYTVTSATTLTITACPGYVISSPWPPEKIRKFC